MYWLFLLVIPVGMLIALIIGLELKSKKRFKQLNNALEKGLLERVNKRDYRNKYSENMTCDTCEGDGNIYFYNKYCEWLNRETNKGWRLYYKDISDIASNFENRKKIVQIKGKGASINLYLYKANTLIELLENKRGNH